MKKLLHIDCETTGLQPWKNDIIQLAGIIEIDDVIEEEFDVTMQPRNWDAIEKKALEVQHRTLSDLKLFQDPMAAYGKILAKFDKYINKFDKKDKFQVIGFNVGFDIKFLEHFFKKSRNNFIFSYLKPYPVDLYPVAIFLHYVGFIPDLENYKLETLCSYYDIELSAHDALNDIRATRQLFNIFTKGMKIMGVEDPKPIIEEKSIEQKIPGII